ncbi:MAG: hypothetical protein R2912_12435 [Eubacteriales bacterium]
MKENRINRRSGGLRGRVKKSIAIVIALALVFAFSASALADNGRGGGQPDGQLTQDKKDPRGNRNTEVSGVNIAKLQEAIAAVEDTTVQSSLTALLDTYVDALEARQDALDAHDNATLRDLNVTVAAAKAALDAALDEAGVLTDELYGVPEEALDGTGRTFNRPGLDLDEIAAAIAALDDADANKAALTALLAAYEDALAALNAADLTTLTKEEIAALEDAVLDAEKALLEATKEADVTGGAGRGQFVSGYAYGNTEMNTLQISAQIEALEDGDELKVQLQERLAAYEAALAAEQNAGANLTAQERSALRDATNEAADALKQALENAGLDTHWVIRNQEGELYSIQTMDGNDGVNPPEQEGFFSSILSWLESLFH